MGYHHKLRATNFKRVGSPGATVGKSDLSSPAPCHKARGIHNFILVTKSPVWIIIKNIALLVTKRVEYTILFWPPKALYG